jgi:hypothetical protein
MLCELRRPRRQVTVLLLATLKGQEKEGANLNSQLTQSRELWFERTELGPSNERCKTRKAHTPALRSLSMSGLILGHRDVEDSLYAGCGIRNGDKFLNDFLDTSGHVRLRGVFTTEINEGP